MKKRIVIGALIGVACLVYVRMNIVGMEEGSPAGGAAGKASSSALPGSIPLRDLEKDVRQGYYVGPMPPEIVQQIFRYKKFPTLEAFLRPVLSMRKIKTLLRVMSVEFSPDGSKVATGSEDETVGIWDANTGQELHTLKAEAKVRSIAFSPDGSKVMTGCSAHEKVGIWDVNTGQKLHKFRTGGSVGSIVFSPDGSRVATVSDSARDISYIADIWNVDTGQKLRTFQDGQIYAVKFKGSMSKVVTGPREYAGHVWDANTGALLYELNYLDWIRAVEFSEDASRLLTWGNEVCIRDANNGTRLRTLQYGPGQLTISRDWSKAVMVSGNEAVLWDVNTGMRMHTLRHSSNIIKVVLSPDGSKLATGSAREGVGNIIEIWDVNTGQRSQTLQVGSLWVFFSLSFSPDGSKFVAPSTNNRGAVIWGLITADQVEQLIDQSKKTFEQIELLEVFNQLLGVSRVGNNIPIIQATPDQWQTFLTFPEEIQDALRAYIEAHIEEPAVHRERLIKSWSGRRPSVDLP